MTVGPLCCPARHEREPRSSSGERAGVGREREWVGSQGASSQREIFTPHLVNPSEVAFNKEIRKRAFLDLMMSKSHFRNTGNK